VAGASPERRTNRATRKRGANYGIEDSVAQRFHLLVRCRPARAPTDRLAFRKGSNERRSVPQSRPDRLSEALKLLHKLLAFKGPRINAIGNKQYGKPLLSPLAHCVNDRQGVGGRFEIEPGGRAGDDDET
jgi:hypothetical protein